MTDDDVATMYLSVDMEESRFEDEVTARSGVVNVLKKYFNTVTKMDEREMTAISRVMSSLETENDKLEI